MDNYFVIGRPGKLRPTPVVNRYGRRVARPRATAGARPRGRAPARLRAGAGRPGGRRPCPLRGTMKRLRAAPKYTMGVRRSFPGPRIVAHL